MPKANKDNYTLLKLYRVISLLNCLGKVLEKVFVTRLSYLANITKFLHLMQLGSRKQRLAIDITLLLTHYIELQFLSRRVAS